MKFFGIPFFQKRYEFFAKLFFKKRDIPFLQKRCEFSLHNKKGKADFGFPLDGVNPLKKRKIPSARRRVLIVLNIELLIVFNCFEFLDNLLLGSFCSKAYDNYCDTAYNERGEKLVYREGVNSVLNA